MNKKYCIVHNLIKDESRIISSIEDCKDSTERSAYKKFIKTGDVITMGKTIIEPMKNTKQNIKEDLKLDVMSQVISPINKKLTDIMDDYTNRLKSKLINKKVTLFGSVGQPDQPLKKSYTIIVNDVQVNRYKDEFYVVLRGKQENERIDREYYVDIKPLSVEKDEVQSQVLNTTTKPEQPLNEVIVEDRFLKTKHKKYVDNDWNKLQPNIESKYKTSELKYIYEKGWKDGYNFADEKYSTKYARFYKINESTDNVIKKAWDSVKYNYHERDYKVSGVPIMFVDGFKLGYKQAKDNTQ